MQLGLMDLEPHPSLHPGGPDITWVGHRESYHKGMLYGVISHGKVIGDHITWVGQHMGRS